MRSFPAWSLTFALLASVSCGGNKGDAVSDAPLGDRIAVADATTTELIAAVGDGAALVFVLRDEGWGAARERFGAAFDGRKTGPWGDVAESSDPMAAVWALTKALGLGLPKPALEGRDLSRPVVVSAFESPYDGPPGAAISMIANTDGRHPPSRYQLVVPATDVAAVTSSLQTWISAGATAAPDLVAGRAGAIGFRLDGAADSASHVALLPESDHVRVVLLHDSHSLDATEVRPWLDVSSANLPDTPATRHAAGGYPMALLVRPWRLRSFGAWYGLEQAQRAVETVAIDQSNSARARGLAIASSIALLTPEDNAEFDDWAFAATGAKGQLSLTAVASLTEQGQKVWKAGSEMAERPFDLKREVLADAFVSGDVAAMLSAAGKHQAPQVALSDLVRTFRMCGALCPTYFAMRWPLAGLKTAADARLPVRLATDAGLMAAHVAWVDGGASGPVWAVALIGGETQLASLGSMLGGVSGRTKLQTHRTKRGDKSVLLLGAGVDPATVFATETAGSGHSDVAHVSATAKALGLPVPASARLRMAGTALTAEVGFGPGALTFAPDFEGLSWPSPMRSAPSTKAAGCLQDAVAVVHTQLDAAARSTGAEAPKLYAAAYDAVAASLQCTAEDAALVPAARRLGDAIAIIAARGHLAQTQVEGARAILRKQCGVDERKGPACDAATKLGKAGTPTLPRHAKAARCNSDYAWSMGSPMIVESGEALFADRSVKTTPAAVSAMIIDAMTMEARYGKSAPAVSVAASGDTPFGTVFPALRGIAALGRHPSLLARGEDAELVAVPISADLDSAASTDWKVREGYRPEFPMEEEEPPPEVSPPSDTLPQEGKMGRPTSKRKSGLYAMKGPQAGGPAMGDRSRAGAAVLAVELSKSKLTVVLPDGKRADVRDAAVIGEIASHARDVLGRSRELVVTLTVAPDVPWSRYVELSVATCRDPLVLVQP